MADPQPIPPPVLNLDTLLPSATVRIDGIKHELRSADQLSLLELRRFEQLRRQMNLLLAKDELSAEDEAHVSRLADQQCRIVLGAPADVHARLTDVQRMHVISAFLELPGRTRQGTAANPTAAARPARSTGAKPSRSSSASTTARRRTRG